MRELVYLDFETKSTVDLRKTGSHVYAQHPTTEVLCLGYCFNDEIVQIWTPNQKVWPDRLLNHVNNGGTVVGHNVAGFELLIWNYVCGPKYYWPALKVEQLECTMAMAYAMSLPGSLEKAAAAAGIDKQKDLKGGRVMLQLSQPRNIAEDGAITWWNDEDKFKILYDYCKQDVEVERELYKRLSPLSEEEKELWILDHKINSRGVQVDLDSCKTALELVEYEKNRLDQEMKAITSNQVVTCSAVAQLTDWIKSKGIELDGVAKADVTSLLNQEIPEDVRCALLLRQEAAKSSTAKLQSILQSACTDGRIRGLFQYHGAGTGRWAGRRVQLQNLPRPKISQEDIESVFKILNADNGRGH